MRTHSSARPNNLAAGGFFIRAAASLPGYRQDVELRQLEAFVAVATELHFGRAAERLHLAAPTLSELIRRLERELGTPLFTRTTRRVAITSAGAELLTRSKVILDEVAAAKAAMRRVADGEAGTVRLGITPPAAPVLAPHLIRLFAAQAPQVTVELQRMWLPNLLDAVVTGDIDVALTCGPVPEPAGVATEVFCAEPLLVGLRPGHRLASHDLIALSELTHDVLGTAPEALFPAWALTQRQALDTASIAPPTIELADTDLAAIRWADQPDIDWVLVDPVPGGCPHPHRHAPGGAPPARAIHPAMEPQLGPHRGRCPVRPLRAGSRSPARLAYPARSPAPHRTKPGPGRTPTRASTAIRLRPGKLTPRRNERAGVGGPVDGDAAAAKPMPPATWVRPPRHRGRERR